MNSKEKRFQYFIKRTFDIVVAIIGLTIGVIFLPLVWLVIRFDLGSPIFFIQERIGKDNKKFKVIKLRTMTDGTDKEGNLLPDEKRLTVIGKKIRSSSIDEVPQLINVIKGEMSFVGPRPLLVEYLHSYSKEQIKRHDVLPGLTGWAQVNGRNAISWTNKLELDVFYVENWSLLLDLKIIILTIYKIFKKDGINKDGNSTTDKFDGKN